MGGGVVCPPWNMDLKRLQNPVFPQALDEEEDPELWQPTLPTASRPTSKKDQKRFMGHFLGCFRLERVQPSPGESLVHFLRPIQANRPADRKGRRLAVWKKKRELVVNMPAVVKFPYLSGLTGCRDKRGTERKFPTQSLDREGNLVLPGKI